MPSARAQQPILPRGLSEGEDQEKQGGDKGPARDCQEEGRGGGGGKEQEEGRQGGDRKDGSRESLP